MKSNTNKVNIWVLTIIGLGVGLISGVIAMNYNLFPEEANAQVYVAFSLICAGLAYFIGNRNFIN